MSYGGRCTYCGNTVDTNGACYRITGYEQARPGGGANRIIGRDRLPGWVAHWACLDKALRRERTGDQAALFP